MLEFAAPEEVGLSPAGLDTVDQVVQDAVDQGQIAGAATLTARHGTDRAHPGLRDWIIGSPRRRSATTPSSTSSR